jgi:hypothetical protein
LTVIKKFDGALCSMAVGTAILLSACGGHAAAPSAPSAAAGLAQASGFSGNSTQRVDAWFNDAGKAELDNLIDAIDGVQRAPNTAAALGAACGKLAGAVASAQAGPQVPNAAAQSSFASALSEFAKAAADCQAGASSNDSALLTSASAAISAGSTDLGTFESETEDAQTKQLRSQQASQCKQLYQAWKDGPAHTALSQFLAALGAVPEINSGTNLSAAAAAAEQAAQPTAQLAGFPVPACADPAGYFAKIVSTVDAAAAGATTAASQSAAAQALAPLNGLPTLEAEFTDEVNTATGS